MNISIDEIIQQALDTAALTGSTDTDSLWEFAYHTLSVYDAEEALYVTPTFERLEEAFHEAGELARAFGQTLWDFLTAEWEAKDDELGWVPVALLNAIPDDNGDVLIACQCGDILFPRRFIRRIAA